MSAPGKEGENYGIDICGECATDLPLLGEETEANEDSQANARLIRQIMRNAPADPCPTKCDT